MHISRHTIKISYLSSATTKVQFVYENLRSSRLTKQHKINLTDAAYLCSF